MSTTNVIGFASIINQCLNKSVFPISFQEWKEVAQGFASAWNFPNCVGAIDGKHVVMQAPPLSGSGFYNYKNQHSLVLMAACDSNYCFTFVGKQTMFIITVH